MAPLNDFDQGKEIVVSRTKVRRGGAPGTTEDRPRWEGPPENRPRGYLPAKDNPAEDRDAAGENLRDPEKSNLSDAFKTKED